MADYYEMTITCTGSSIGENSFSVFDDKTKVFDTPEEVIEYLKCEYEGAKRSQAYRGDSIPCGYVYTFENADWSHSPVERWMQQDWVNVYKIHAENAFKEVDHEVS